MRPRDVRQTEPQERHVPTGRRQHKGLFVVDEWHWAGGMPAWIVISVATMERQQQRSFPPPEIRAHVYHGMPGLTWEAAQELKRELRRKP